MTPVLAIIRGYYKKIDALVDPDLHIYDLPDIRPSLPPRQRKLEPADELLHTVDREQSRDNLLKLDDGSKMGKNCDNGFKRRDCEQVQLLTRKLQFSECCEHNVTSIPEQINSAYKIHALGLTEKLEELSSNSSEFPMVSVHSSEQTGSYEQIHGYEIIEHCDINLAQLINKHSKQISHSHENSQLQCHLPDCDQECKGHNLENPTESVQLTESVQSGSLTIDCKYRNLRDLEISQSNAYERIHHCDLVIPHALKKIPSNDESPPHVYVVEDTSEYERIKHCDLPIKLMLNSMSMHAEYPTPVREDETLQGNDTDSLTGTTHYDDQPTESVQLTVQSESLTKGCEYQNLQGEKKCNQAQSNVYERIHHCDLPIEVMPQALKKISKNDNPPSIIEETPKYERINHCDLPIELLRRQVLEHNELF